MREMRTSGETAELFWEYSWSFWQEAIEFEKKGMEKEAAFARGKSEAYENAAFEMTHNME